MRKPRVIPDEDHEVVYERVAAVDVAKASGVVCMRLPDPARPGRYANQIWDNVPAARARITELGRELLRHQVQMVTLESTSDYWRIWYYVLESTGLAVQLVSASQARNLKGRPKTDKLDAMWLARLTQWGMLRPSFVPPAAIRQVRDFTRARTNLVHERTRVLQRLEKLLEDAMVKITSVVSDGMKAKSAVAMVAALVAGERDPRAIADLAKGSLRGKRDALAEALDVRFPSRGDRPGAAGPGRVLGPADHPDGGRRHRGAGPGGGILGGGRHRGNRTRPRHRPGLAGASRRLPAGRDPRRQRVAGHRDHRRDRPEHGVVPYPGAPGLLDGAVPVRRPVRHPARQGQAEERQQLHPRRRRAGRHRRGQAPPPSSASGMPASPAAAAGPSPRSRSPVPS